MPTKPVKTSNYTGKNLEGYVKDVDNDLKNIASYLNYFPRIYVQAAEPSIIEGSFAFWKDTDNSKFYLLLKIGSDQKKVELT